MTTTAHNARRPWGGASLARNVGPGTAPRVSMYQLLHPEQFAEIPSSKKVKPQPPKRRSPGASDKAIRDYLAQGDATTAQIAAVLGLTYNAVHMCLHRGLDGIVRKGTTLKRGALVQLWGLQDIHTGKENE